MEDDTYQSMVDYENEIYDLNHDLDNDSEAEQESNQNNKNDDMTDAEEPETSNRSNQVPEQQPNEIKLLQNGLEQSDSDLSEDEREMILSRLYHSSNAFPTVPKDFGTTEPTASPSKAEKPRKGKISDKKKKPKPSASTEQEVPPIPSKEFTFEIDLDNLPPPPDLTLPPKQVITLDEYGDFGVYPPQVSQLTSQFPSRGRYFGPPEPDRPSSAPIICFRCNQPGHIKLECPHQICSYCGALDAHSSFRCPTRVFCQNCAQSGHPAAECPFKKGGDLSRPCTMCGGSGHVATTCHQIWRYYMPVPPSEMKEVSEIERYCYNCAEKGHLGDECPRPRPFHVQGGRIGEVLSAFGEGNVPEWARKKNTRKIEYQEEEDEDNWFEQRQRERERRVGGIKGRQGDGVKPPVSASIRQGSRDVSPQRWDSRNSYSSRSSYDRRKRPAPYDHRDSSDWDLTSQRWKRDRDEDKYNPKLARHIRLQQRYLDKR